MTAHYHLSTDGRLGDPVGSRGHADAELRHAVGRLAVDDVNIGRTVTLELAGDRYVLRSADDYIHGEHTLGLIECSTDHERTRP